MAMCTLRHYAQLVFAVSLCLSTAQVALADQTQDLSAKLTLAKQPQRPVTEEVADYGWVLSASGRCRVSVNFATIEPSAKPHKVHGITYVPDDHSKFEINLQVRVDEEGNVHLAGDVGRSDKTKFKVDMPDDATRLADQMFHFRPATMKKGEFRVLWDGWIGKDTQYVKHCQLIVGLLGEDDTQTQFVYDSTALPIRLNGKLNAEKEFIVGKWTEVTDGTRWQLDLKPDGTFTRTSGLAAENERQRGTWQVRGERLSLSGEVSIDWKVTDFWIADARTGVQHLAVVDSDGNQSRFGRTLGDLRTGLKAREQIGTSSGKPVYRDQIRRVGFGLRSELHRLFSQPVMKKYREEHREQITPTQHEIEAATDFFAKAHQKRVEGEYGDILRKDLARVRADLKKDNLSAEDRRRLENERDSVLRQLHQDQSQHAMTANWVLNNWKFQRHLYSRYDRGRVLWQQAGMEAFDAMRVCFETHEGAGDFEITDAKLRQEFYAYWTNEKMHGSFLTDDPERIREFLEPSWLKREAAK